MNFLAHAYLSGENNKILVGNFIADFVKGRQQLAVYETEIVKGIEFHRAIDAFTDTHEIVRLTKSHLRPKYHHYSGVIADVFYDHFLAKNWNKYHQQPLADFASYVYATVHTYESILPEGVKRMFPYMMRGNWLLNYAKIEGIHRALTGMSNRTPYVSRMDEAVHDLRDQYEIFQKEFEGFFPLLIGYCAHWLAENSQVRE
jgi:acyl carrier protein phosphodiesterase